jgi:hypothetical protein
MDCSSGTFQVHRNQVVAKCNVGLGPGVIDKTNRFGYGLLQRPIGMRGSQFVPKAKKLMEFVLCPGDVSASMLGLANFANAKVLDRAIGAPLRSNLFGLDRLGNQVRSHFPGGIAVDAVDCLAQLNPPRNQIR